MTKEDVLLLLEARTQQVSSKDHRRVQKLGMLHTLRHYLEMDGTLSARQLNSFRDLVGSVARRGMKVEDFTRRLFRLVNDDAFHGAVTAAVIAADPRTGQARRALEAHPRRVPGDGFEVGQAILYHLYSDPPSAPTTVET